MAEKKGTAKRSRSRLDRLVGRLSGEAWSNVSHAGRTRRLTFGARSQSSRNLTDRKDQVRRLRNG